MDVRRRKHNSAGLHCALVACGHTKGPELDGPGPSCLAAYGLVAYHGSVMYGALKPANVSVYVKPESVMGP